MFGAFLESAHANAAVGENYSLRRDILFFGRELDIQKAFVASLGQNQMQSRSGIASAPLPRNDTVPDVPQTPGRQSRSAGLPPQAYRAGEVAIPHPAPEAGEARSVPPVRQTDGPALSLTVIERTQEGVCVGRDQAQMFRSRFVTLVVGRPASLQGCNITFEVLRRRFDESERTRFVRRAARGRAPEQR